MARRARKNQEVTLGRRQRRRKEQRRKNVKEVIGTILYLVILCTIVYFILHYVGQRTVVRGDSMDTTLSDGQNLIMDKLSYRFHEPERYDIVIFPGPEEYGEHPYYIKRIIGLPGTQRRSFLQLRMYLAHIQHPMPDLLLEDVRM